MVPEYTERDICCFCFVSMVCYCDEEVESGRQSEVRMEKREETLNPLQEPNSPTKMRNIACNLVKTMKSGNITRWSSFLSVYCLRFLCAIISSYNL